MYAYALFCDTTGCRESIYIPSHATAPGPAFQLISEHAFQQGWSSNHCPRHIPPAPRPTPTKEQP